MTQPADLAKGIVRILHPNGSTAGTGFVVSADGLIATCSHVVQSERSQRDGELRPERVTAVFDAAGEQREAIVETNWWRSYDSGDIAILRVEGCGGIARRTALVAVMAESIPASPF